MANIVKLTATFDDGSTEDIFPVAASVAAPTITEVDVKKSDGSEEVMVPQA